MLAKLWPVIAAIAALANYHDLVMLFAGPERKDLYIKQDETMAQIADGLQIDKTLIPDEDEKKQVIADIDAARQQQMAAMFAAEAAKQAPGIVKEAAVSEMRRAA